MMPMYAMAPTIAAGRQQLHIPHRVKIPASSAEVCAALRVEQGDPGSEIVTLDPTHHVFPEVLNSVAKAVASLESAVAAELVVVCRNLSRYDDG